MGELWRNARNVGIACQTYGYRWGFRARLLTDPELPHKMRTSKTIVALGTTSRLKRAQACGDRLRVQWAHSSSIWLNQADSLGSRWVDRRQSVRHRSDQLAYGRGVDRGGEEPLHRSAERKSRVVGYGRTDRAKHFGGDVGSHRFRAGSDEDRSGSERSGADGYRRSVRVKE